MSTWFLGSELSICFNLYLLLKIQDFPYVTDMHLSDIPLTVDTVYKMASVNVIKAHARI